MQKKIVIVGGGFFGMYLAEFMAKSGHQVKIVEKENRFMARASFNNQARVHNGYHYPRSVLTALRSRIAFPRFVSEFAHCIDTDFDKYYLISSKAGKVTANQFSSFCQRIGASCEPAPGFLHKYTNPALVDACYTVTEYAFDSKKLSETMLDRLQSSSVQYQTGVSVDKVHPHQQGLLVTCTENKSGEQYQVYADHVFNCTYSQINHIVKNSGLELIPLKHEMTEMCLVKVPEELKKSGLTIMCGPFFSVMPFPAFAGLHSFSHVRYTPHYQWIDNNKHTYIDSDKNYKNASRNSAWCYMVKDALRYLPLLQECQYQHSLWEIKTVLPDSEIDDSRPILFKPNYGLQGFHCLMGGKIDNVYDVIEAITKQNILN